MHSVFCVDEDRDPNGCMIECLVSDLYYFYMCNTYVNYFTAHGALGKDCL